MAMTLSGVEIAAEAAGEVHAVHLFRRDAALLQQHADARCDGSLGQLQIAARPPAVRYTSGVR